MKKKKKKIKNKIEYLMNDGLGPTSSNNDSYNDTDN